LSLPIAVADTSVLLATFRRKDDRHDDGVAAFQAAQIKLGTGSR
jgi:predicted nucleic acid-binding protein